MFCNWSGCVSVLACVLVYVVGGEWGNIFGHVALNTAAADNAVDVFQPSFILMRNG